LNRRVPQDLETVCLKAMEKDPSRRYASAGEMAHDLRQYLAHGLITARRAGPIRRTSKWILRHPVLSTAMAASVLLIVASGMVGWTWGERSAEAGQRLVAEAQFLMEAGKPEEALQKADAALDANPDAVEARRIRALALVGIYEWAEAVEVARRLLEHDGRDKTAHRVMILATMNIDLQVASINVEDHLAALSDGSPDSADVLYARAELASSAQEKMELLNRALEREPDHWLALKRREALHCDRKDFAAAWRDAERMEVAVPWYFWGRVGKIRLYNMMNDPANALREADRVTEIHPEDHAGYCFRSFALRRLGRFEEELATVERSNELLELATHFWFLSDIHSRLGDHEKAVVNAKRAIELKPDTATGSESLIRAYLALGKGAEARATLDRMLIEAAEWANPELRIGACIVATDCLARLGKMDEALIHADKIGRIDPINKWQFVERARVLRWFLGLEATAADCAQLAELSDGDLAKAGSVLDAWVDRGNYLRDVCQRYDLALADYDRATETVPDWVDPCRERATVYRLQGNLAGSLYELEKAIELQPNWLDLYHDRGRIYLKQERFDEALGEFHRFLEFGAERDDLRWDQAHALLRLGRADEGIKILEQAIERRPKMDFLRNRLGETLLWLGRVDEAIEAHAGAIRSQPAQAAGHAGRGTARLLSGGDCADIRADFEKALELVPYARERRSDIGRKPSPAVAQDPNEIRNLVAWAQAAYGAEQCPGVFKPEAVIELARKAVGYDPRNPDSHRSLGMALHRAGFHDEARDAFLRSLDLRSHDDAFSRLGLAMAYHALDEAQEASLAYDRGRERGLQVFPGHPGFVRLRNEVEGLLGRNPS
jgi:tetratricopeptide (TPR) repeat protein